MFWPIAGAVLAATSYMLGYFMRGLVDAEKLRKVREEMGLDDVNCYGCKDVGLPCDPKCSFNSITDNEEVSEDGKSEKNDSEEN